LLSQSFRGALRRDKAFITESGLSKHRLPTKPRLSVVVISRNEGASLRRTVQNLDDTLPGAHDIVVVDDGSTDGSIKRVPLSRGRIRVLRGSGLGVTRARNLGARHTNGHILLFADAHLALPSGWWKPLVDELRTPSVAAVAPVIINTESPPLTGFGLTFRGPSMEVRWIKRHSARSVHVPILPGCCLAMRRSVFLETGGWDDGMLHRGNVDNEFSLRHWLLGYELVVTADVAVGHKFREISPYPVGWPEYLHNRLRLAFVHLNEQRIKRVVTALHRERRFGDALLLIAQSDAAIRRSQLQRRRIRDDDWFFERFGLGW
jgi:GT2 family glycosyltransferase